VRIRCDVEEVELEGDHSSEVPGVCVTCRRCGECAEVFGTSGASIRRGLAMLREQCQEGESNFYVAEGDEREPFDDED
jgi:hypothetical protein